MVDQTNQAAVQARAYQLWEENGRVDGSHEEHWRRAEAECGNRMSDGASGDGAPVQFGAEGSSHPSPEAMSDPQRLPTPISTI